MPFNDPDPITFRATGGRSAHSFQGAQCRSPVPTLQKQLSRPIALEVSMTADARSGRWRD
jgi:hypothetical protein